MNQQVVAVAVESLFNSVQYSKAIYIHRCDVDLPQGDTETWGRRWEIAWLWLRF